MRTSFGIAVLWFFSVLSPAHSQNTKVYVAEFQSIKGVPPTLLASLTNEFELLLIETGLYSVLERRNLDRLAAHARSEMRATNVRELDGRTVDLLKHQGTEAVIFGEVDDDNDSGEIVIYATLERFDSKIEWKHSVSIKKGLRYDRDTRVTALRKLLPESRAENQDILAIREFRWKSQSAMNTAISTGDTAALLSLSVDKHNTISPQQQQNMRDLRELVPPQVRQSKARVIFNIERWDVQSFDSGQAVVLVQTHLHGEEMGQPVSNRQSGTVYLAKIKGEWLLAPGGDVK